MLNRSFAAALVAAATFARPPADAATLVYVGNTDGVTLHIILATFEFDSPLDPGAKLSLDDTAWWSISYTGIGPAITKGSAAYSVGEFTIGPDGLPEEWGFYAEEDFQFESAPEQFGSHAGTTTSVFGEATTFDEDLFVTDDPIAGSPEFAVPDFYNLVFQNAGPPGIWIEVPEPTPHLLLLASAAGALVRLTRCRPRDRAPSG